MNRIKTAIIVLVILIIAIISSKILSSKDKTRLNHSQNSSRENKIYVVKNLPYEKTIRTSGRMFSYDGFTIYSEVNGLILDAKKLIKEGNYYKKGEVIVKIDDSIYANQLRAKRSALLNLITLVLPDFKYDFPNEFAKWNEYLDKLNPEKPLPPLPKITSAREKYYLASKNVLQTYYEIKSMEATHSKYRIKAPFNGYLVSAFIGEGEMVKAGQKIGRFINSNLFEMSAPVSLNDVHFLKVGLPVTLKEIAHDKKLKGKIARINRSVSQESQSVLIFIQSKDKSIHDGAYYDAIITTHKKELVAKIPKEAFDRFGNVTIKKDSKLINIKPKIYDSSPLYYFVTGLKDGTEIVLPANYTGNLPE